MTMRRALRSRRLRGFTLVEVLVAMALLSVLMLALGSALRTVGQAEVRIDQRLARLDDFRTGTTFIKSALGRVSARKVNGLQQQGAGTLFFDGQPGGIAWVGVMPARFGAGGRYFFRLTMENTGNSSGMVVRFVPWTDIPGFPDWSQADSRILVADATAMTVRYEDGKAPPAGAWLPAWRVADRLPSRVSIQVATTNGAWVDLVVPLRQPGSAGAAVFVIGGRSS